MEFQEYPKWVYPDGDSARGLVVQDAGEFATYLKDPATFEIEAARRDGRPVPVVAAREVLSLPVVDEQRVKRKYTRKAMS